MAQGGWVYIMADRYRGTMYIGVTSNIASRAWAHKEGRGSQFCKRYRLKRLVYAEPAPTIEEAIAREKAIKNWERLEDRADRASESRGERPVRNHQRLKEAGFPLSRE